MGVIMYHRNHTLQFLIGASIIVLDQPIITVVMFCRMFDVFPINPLLRPPRWTLLLEFLNQHIFELVTSPFLSFFNRCLDE